MKDKYVILTGSKNNAGDYLIKYRAKQLFAQLRPDREIVDLNGWEVLSNENLKLVNNSKALILLGGPALQNKMYPNIYGLRSNLNDIKVPIIMMGIGWYSKRGEWEDTYTYKLDNNSQVLLKKIAKSGFLSSVRDYHTLNTLQNLNMHNILMTGCPALYDECNIGKKYSPPKDIKRIGFSLGVSMNLSKKMKYQMKQVLFMLHEYFPNAEIVIAFHHSLSDTYLNADRTNSKLYHTHIDFKDWLEREKFKYIDISGSAEKLIDFYSRCDFHIGYRVHAHIFMSSISKRSLLISEDGRGKALEKVIGGNIINGYKSVKNNILIKMLRKIGIHIDQFKPNEYLLKDLKHIFMYDLENDMKFSQQRIEIDRYYPLMKKFIKQLP